MVLQTSPGSLAEKFFFTTKDENLIKMTNQNIGKKLHWDMSSTRDYLHHVLVILSTLL